MVEVKEKPVQEVSRKSGKQRAKLDKWTYDGVRLHGLVYDHPKLSDGEYVHTTRVTWIDQRSKIAETRNTIYILLRKSGG